MSVYMVSAKPWPRYREPDFRSVSLKRIIQSLNVSHAGSLWRQLAVPGVLNSGILHKGSYTNRDPTPNRILPKGILHYLIQEDYFKALWIPHLLLTKVWTFDSLVVGEQSRAKIRALQVLGVLYGIS